VVFLVHSFVKHWQASEYLARGHAIYSITLHNLETHSCFGMSKVIYRLCEEAYKISYFVHGNYITYIRK